MRTAALNALLFCSILITATAAPAAPRDLLAHGDADDLWTARAGTVTDTTPNYEQSELRGRSGFGENWSPLPTLSPRVISMASNKHELIVVLQDGQWFAVGPDSPRPGPPLPNSARILAVGSDSDSLWAIGQAAVSAASTLPAATSLESEHLPTTEPTSSPSMSATVHHLFVYHYVDGEWNNKDAIQLPDAVSDDPARLSMTIINHQPIVAWHGGDGSIHIIRLGIDHQWSIPIVINPHFPIDDFKILAVQTKPALWILPARAPTTAPAATRPAPITGGILYKGDDFSTIKPLAVTGIPAGADTRQALAEGVGSLRLIAQVDGKWYEQRYKPDDSPDETAAAVVEASPPVIPLGPWIGGSIMVILAAIALAVFQRRNPPEPPPAAPTTPEPQQLQVAPLGLRFSAGIVDLLPVLGAIYALQDMTNKDGTLNVDHYSAIHLLVLAAVTYVLHTLIAELLCAQSLGKMMFNLRIVGPTGLPPKPSAIILRNLARILDLAILPLFIILFTPLHQRLADLSTGTVVISKDPEPEPDQTPPEE